MMLIFLNSIFLAFYDYSDENDETVRNQTLNTGGRVFTVLFTMEAICKIIAQGFLFHRKSYLRNGWNWLDLLVIVVGWVEIIPNMPTFRGFRTFRVLGPSERSTLSPISRTKSYLLLSRLASSLMCFYSYYSCSSYSAYWGFKFTKANSTNDAAQLISLFQMAHGPQHRALIDFVRALMTQDGTPVLNPISVEILRTMALGQNTKTFKKRITLTMVLLLLITSV